MVEEVTNLTQQFEVFPEDSLWQNAFNIITRFANEERSEYYLEERSLQTYMNIYRMFKQYFSMYVSVRQIQTEDIRTYLVNLRLQRRSFSYTNLIYYSLSYAFKLWFNLQIISYDPTIGALPPRARAGARRLNRARVTIPLSSRELFVLLTTIDQANRTKWDEDCKERDWLLMALAYATNLRNEELLSIKIRDINFERRTIYVRRKGGEEKDVIITDLLKIPYQHSEYSDITGIEETDRCLICSSLRTEENYFTNSICNICQSQWNGFAPDIMIRLQKYIANNNLREEDKLFNIGERWFQKRVKKWAKRANLDAMRIYPHAFRHTYGTDMGALNVNAFILKELMNHQNLATTSIYVSLNNIERLQDSLHELGIFNNIREE